MLTSLPAVFYKNSILFNKWFGVCESTCAASSCDLGFADEGLPARLEDRLYNKIKRQLNHLTIKTAKKRAGKPAR